MTKEGTKKTASKAASATKAGSIKGPAPKGGKVTPEQSEELLARLEKIAKDNNMTFLNWEPGKLKAFIQGQMTLAQLEGMSSEELLKMASTAFRLMNQGRDNDARKIFEGLAVFDPYNAYYSLALGSIAQRQHNFDGAEAYYTRALELDRSLIAAHVNRGESRVFLGKFLEAIKDFIDAIELDKDNRDQATLRAKVMLAAINQKIKEAQGKPATATAKK